MRWVGWLVALLWLAGCGGGGGGSSPAKPALLSLSPSTATVVTTQGARGNFVVTGTLSQQALDTIDHVRLSDEGGHLDTQIDVQTPSEAVANITFYTHPGLPVGQYTGRLNFYLCMDQECRSTATPTPFSMTYHITVNQAPPAATITPSAISATMESGDHLSITLDAQIVPGLQVGSFAVTDIQQRFTPAVQIVSQADQHFTLQLTAYTAEGPGTYSGTVQLLACNASYSCAEGNQVPGSPVAIPYTLTVTPEQLLPTVPSVSGLPEWETFQGNPAHTGHVPVTLNPNDFTAGWSWTAPGTYTRLTPATTGSGKVVVAGSAGNGVNPTLYALNETDGSVAWRYDFGDVHQLNHPAVSSGRAFVATSGHEDTFMWSFDIQTGVRQFQTPFQSQWESYLAPIVHNGHVFANGGYYGGMYSFKALNGSLRWFTSLEQYDLWSPAADDDNVYAYAGYEFSVIDRRDGERTLVMPNYSFNWRGYALNIAPVLPGDGSVVVVDGIYNYSETVHNNHLIRYDVGNASEAWRLDGQFRSNPAVHTGNLYVINNDGGRLQALDLASGAVLWSWSPSSASETLPIGNTVLTDNLIFLSSSAATYAIDLNTHLPVWSTPNTGHLALSSNRILYIVNEANGRIDSYRLAQ